MTIAPLYIYPHPRLRMTSIPVEMGRDADVLPALARQLVSTMRAHNGAGLSAIQIGVCIRVLAIADADNDADLVVCNPRIDLQDKALPTTEGCLSFPGQFVDVRRHPKVELYGSFYTGFGEPTLRDSITLEGVPAQAAQHELEHLDGKLLIDHAGILEKAFIESRMKKYNKDQIRKHGQ